MPTELKIPPIGESISEVQIVEWLKADGEEVKKDENLAVIDSEKTTVELPSPVDGRLKILHQAGETVRVGETVAQIEAGNGGPEKSASPAAKAGEAEAEKKAPAAPEPKKQPPKKKTAAEVQPAEKAAESSTEQPKSESESEPEPEQATPEKKPDAQANGTKGTKAETKSENVPERAAESPDLKAYAAPRLENNPPIRATPKPMANEPKTSLSSAGPEKVVPMTMLRRTVARRLVEAKQAMAMLTTFNEVDMSAVQSLRKEHQEIFEKRHQVKLGFMSFFVKAVVGALKQFPQLNAEIRENDIVYHQRFDIGVAIASERGLIVPVLRNADSLSFAEIERAIGDFSRRAREGNLKPSELTGGTFTITNGGVFGSLLSTPIINPPQSGILGMHSIQERPIALNGQVVIRPMMYIALTYDHRLVDGREAVMFLRGVKEAIDMPARMLIEI